MMNENLDQQMLEIKSRSPKMPKYALSDFKDDILEPLKLIRQADALAAELYPTCTTRGR